MERTQPPGGPGYTQVTSGSVTKPGLNVSISCLSENLGCMSSVCISAYLMFSC